MHRFPRRASLARVEGGCAIIASLALVLSSGLVPAGVAHAGVINPNISVIGQPVVTWTDDPESPDRKRAVFDVGETEIVFDDYLNPYARGYFTLSLSEDEGAALEEGYVSIFRGLPLGLNVKAGKYRLGFGKLNGAHPHTYPFVGRFHVLANYLPGDEAFNETAVQLSSRLPAPGEIALTASVDWLRGDTFRIEREDSGEADDPLAADGDRAVENRPGVLARLSGFFLIGDRSGLELGLSAAHGTNNVAAGTHTTLFGADAKLKLWTSDRNYWLVQTEFLKLDREETGWQPGRGYTSTSVKPAGFYAFADYNWNLRWYAGASYERYGQASVDETTDQAFRAYAGFSLMEETTLFTLAYERFLPGTLDGATEDPQDVDTISFRIIYSMGPHKAHQF